ncbi:MAG TPA: serine--tRNA ligase [Patescibacteria group bacterium]
MLDIKIIREEPQKVRDAFISKGHPASLVDDILAADEKLQPLRRKVEDLRAERNKIAAMGPHAAEQGKKIKQELEGISNELTEATEHLDELLLSAPNLPSSDTPVGKDDSENVVVREWGTKPHFDFTPKPHWELGEELDIIDNQRAAKVSGARFTYLKGRLALLQFALIQLAMQVVTDQDTLQKIIADHKLSVPAKPFTPVVPPVLIRPEAFQRMARLEPKDERYYIPSDDVYLIGSAEHTLGAMHMDEVILESELPIRYVGYSTAFRREAGSYGKDTKGILRLHQFDKVELEAFTTPEQGLEEQNFFVAIQEYLMQQLNIPYQVLLCCTGDQGDPDARHLDINSWMPGQDTYRETHSSDYMTDYQARRLKTRVKRTATENQYVHTNDATAFAIGRTLIAVMENYQQADGSIKVPEVLVPYCGFSEIR